MFIIFSFVFVRGNVITSRDTDACAMHIATALKNSTSTNECATLAIFCGDLCSNFQYRFVPRKSISTRRIKNSTTSNKFIISKMSFFSFFKNQRVFCRRPSVKLRVLP